MLIIGHRGARGLAPENTLASFEKALEYKVDEIEFDVRVSRDSVPVLHHNRIVEMNGQKLSIRHANLADLQRFKPDLTTLQAALDSIAARVVLLIEVKGGEPTAPIIKVLQHELGRGTYNAQDILLGSKSQRTLRELHRALPEIEKVVIEPFSGVRAGYRARQLKAKRLNMRSWWLWSGFIKALHRRGFKVVAYTINNPQSARKWEKYGLFGVVTDFPDRFASSKS